MRDHPSVTLTIVIFCLTAVMACGTSEAASNPFLENVLGASDDREFNKALSIYGTLQSEDVATVVKAVGSYSERRRKYAAYMLHLCRQDNCKESQLTVTRQTKDLLVWATLVEDAAKNEEKILRERPDFLTKALESDNSEILAPAIRVALKIEWPGIQEKVVKLLDSKEPKVLEVILNNLSPSAAAKESSRLAQMLQDDKTYGDVDMQIALALVRGGDPKYYPDIRAFVDRLKKEKSDHLFFNEATFSEDKAMVDLLWKIARMKDTEVLGDLRDQAFDALTRRVWAPTMHEPATPELVEMAIGYLKTDTLATDPRSHMNLPSYGVSSALYLIAYLNKGNTDFDSHLYGKNAIDFAEKWLREHK